MPSYALRAWRQGFSPQRTIWIAGLGVALSLPGDLTLYVVLPTHTPDAGIALADVGLMLSANRLIRILLNGPYGVIIERIPRRRMGVPALFAGALAALLYTVPGFWPLLIGRLLWGAAWAGLWLSASAIALDVSTGDNRGRLVGRLQMWYFIGIGMASLVGGVLTDWLGYRAAFRACSTITLAGALMWWLCLPETQPTRPEGTPAPADPVSTPGTLRRPGRVGVPLVTAIALLGLNWLIFLGILGATLPLLLEERVGPTIRLAGLLIPLATFTGALAASNQVLGLIASPLAGWLSDLSGNRWGLVMASLALGIAAMGLTAVGTDALLVGATMIGAVATSVLRTQVMTLIGDYARHDRRGRVLGILNTVGDAGSAAGPLVAYALLPLIGLSGVFGLATAVLAIAFPWALRVARQEARERRSPTRQAG